VLGAEERCLLQLSSNNFGGNIERAGCCLGEGRRRYEEQEVFVFRRRVLRMEAKRFRINVPRTMNYHTTLIQNKCW
jgi:hypothetical protein